MGQAGGPRRPGRAAAAAVLVAIAVTACATSPSVPSDSAPASIDPAVAVLEPAQLGPDQPVPAPTGAAVLTVTGLIRSTNGGRVLRLDQDTLDRLGRVRVTVFEPWVRQTLGFQGVWLSDLLALAQPDPAARTVHVTALDDYQVDLSVADVRAGGILLATRDGAGNPIRIEDGGPTRIVFAGGVPSGASADQWIWSLATIDLR